MEKIKQKTEGIINFINNGIDFELLTIMQEIILTTRENTYPAYTNCMTYKEWFKHFKNKTQGIFNLIRPRLKDTEICENQIILVLDYLKLNYEIFFLQVNGMDKPNMAVERKCNLNCFENDFTKNVYNTIEIWENSKN